MDTPLPAQPMAFIAPMVDTVTERPIRLEVTSEGKNRLLIRVIGETSRSYVSRFTLIVDAGGNRSVHRGRGELVRSGVKQELSRVEVRLAASSQWSVTLKVDGPPAYEIVERSGAER